MPTVVDLGWCMARASVQPDETGIPRGELTICEPASGEEAANSITIIGFEALVALRDAITAELELFEQRQDLSNGEQT